MSHYVYALHNVEGIQYVGVTGDPKARYSHHRTCKPWARECDMRILGQFPDRASAESAERRTISMLRPAHNVDHVPYEPRSGVALIDGPVLTTTEAADRLGVNVQKFHRLAAAHSIEPHLRAPGKRGACFWLTADVEALATEVAA